jgi:S-adenosylmethionine:tRNA ribosyltransferase-isomerase
MLTSELDYDLPPGLIAQHPLIPRDHSRLLVYNRSTGATEHRHISDLPALLAPGDVLVYNESRVLRARLHLRRETGGKVELLFLRRKRPGIWEALARPAGRLHVDEELVLPEESGRFQLAERIQDGRWLVRNLTGKPTEAILEALGEMPLPPYIKASLDDPERYQTVFARETGSAAAPTAGLHFTPALIERIRSAGIAMHPVTLHIGLDTFRPVGEDDLALHQIHTEQYRMPQSTFHAISEARRSGRRVISLGTTSARVIETVFGAGNGGRAAGSGGNHADPPLEGLTSLFITPGYRFQAVDALLTNFHLPRSTLLALVMAFGGVDRMKAVYREAIAEQYRFYSFGDAMLIE